MEWRIGCSGFYYRHWKEVFYPKGLAQKHWFDFYCQHFNTLELNVTFYRFPEISFVENWYKKSPDTFSFAVKAPRIITHYKKFIDTEQLMQEFYDVIKTGLKDKLGTVLFQMPPRFEFSQERLEKMIGSVDKNFDNVFEFRHTSWWNEDVYKLLSKNKITFCGMSHPILPETVIANTNVFYYRMHGVPDLYRSPYSEQQLKIFAKQVSPSGKVKTAYVYFNNDIDASAIANAKQLISITRK